MEKQGRVAASDAPASLAYSLYYCWYKSNADESLATVDVVSSSQGQFASSGTLSRGAYLWDQ